MAELGGSRAARMDIRFQNHVTLLGRVTRSPNTYGEGGRELVFFKLVTKRYIRNRDGEEDEVKDYHDVLITSKNKFILDYVQRNLDQGDRVYLEGSLKYKMKDGADGRTKKPTILLDDLVIVAKAYD